MATQSGLKSSQCSLLATLHHTIGALCSSCVFTFQLFIYQLVSDINPQFTSDKFTWFQSKIVSSTSHCAPYLPSSNRWAERFVQTFKQAMRVGEKDGLSLVRVSFYSNLVANCCITAQVGNLLCNNC